MLLSLLALAFNLFFILFAFFLAAPDVGRLSGTPSACVLADVDANGWAWSVLTLRGVGDAYM